MVLKEKEIYNKLTEEKRRVIGRNKKSTKKTFLKESRDARHNIEMLYNARKSAIDFFDEFTSRASEARHQAKQGTRLKILTPKQLLQRLPIDQAYC